MAERNGGYAKQASEIGHCSEMVNNQYSIYRWFEALHAPSDCSFSQARRSSNRLSASRLNQASKQPLAK